MTTPRRDPDLPLLELIERASLEHKGWQRSLPAGGLDVDAAFREELTSAIRISGRDRVHIARRMSELLGRDITKAQLDSWTAESKEGHRFPAAYLPAFCLAVGTNAPLSVLAERTGVHVSTPRERLIVADAELDAQERDIRRRRQLIKSALDKTPSNDGKGDR